jgi:hypothetical protein
LWVRGRYGDYAKVAFVLDTAADLTSIPIAQAEREGIPFRRTIEGTATGLAGRAATFGDMLRVEVAGREYMWPCNFVFTPPGARDRLPVLGRAGFLEAFDFGIQDEWLTLVRRGSFAYWWRRVCSFVEYPFVRRRTIDQPL